MGNSRRSRKPGRGHDAKGKSITEESYVQLHHWMLQSEACRLLSPAAFKVLVYLTTWHNGYNNGAIGFGVRSGCFYRGKREVSDAERYIGLSTRWIGSALQELEAMGFIACEKQSLWTGTKGKAGHGLIREWRLTWWPVGEGEDKQPATKDFMRLRGAFKTKNRKNPRPGRPKKQRPQKTKCPVTPLHYNSPSSEAEYTPNPVGTPSTPPSSEAEFTTPVDSSEAECHHIVTIPIPSAVAVSAAVRGSQLAGGVRSQKRSAPTPAADLKATLASRIAARKPRKQPPCNPETEITEAMQAIADTFKAVTP